MFQNHWLGSVRCWNSFLWFFMEKIRKSSDFQSIYRFLPINNSSSGQWSNRIGISFDSDHWILGQVPRRRNNVSGSKNTWIQLFPIIFIVFSTNFMFSVARIHRFPWIPAKSAMWHVRFGSRRTSSTRSSYVLPGSVGPLKNAKIREKLVKNKLF